MPYKATDCTTTIDTAHTVTVADCGNRRIPTYQAANIIAGAAYITSTVTVADRC